MNLLPLVPSPSTGTTNEVAARSHVTQKCSRPRARAMFESVMPAREVDSGVMASSAAPSIEQTVESVCAELGYTTLKDKQKEVIVDFVSGRDVFAAFFFFFFFFFVYNISCFCI